MPVQRQRTVTAGRIARWLLLFCTLFGLALMHTIGHTGSHAGRQHHLGAAMADGADPAIVAGAVSSAATVVPAVGAGAAPLSAVVAGAVSLSTLVSAECPDGHCDGHGSGGMSGWSVCLAVLGGLFAVALLAAFLAWVAAARGPLWEDAAGQSRVPRGPPRRAAGLALASVAVLRI